MINIELAEILDRLDKEDTVIELSFESFEGLEIEGLKVFNQKDNERFVTENN